MSNLDNRDVESLLSNMEPTQKNRDFFSSLSGVDLKELSKWFQGAQLVKDMETYKVYRIEFTDQNGQEQTVEFVMIRNQNGEWIIGGL